MKKTNENKEKVKKTIKRKIKKSKPRKRQKKVNFTSIRRGIVLNFSILIIIALLSTGYISLRYSKESLLEETDKNLASIAFEASKVIEIEVNSQKKNLNNLALRNELKTMDWKIQKKDLLSIVEEVDFLELAVVDP